jgi:hypothetical protein
LVQPKFYMIEAKTQYPIAERAHDSAKLDEDIPVTTVVLPRRNIWLVERTAQHSSDCQIP